MSGFPVKISVIIPVYNVEKYLSSCLTSCVNQTLNDVEFICVNDGSTDDSLKILQEFAKIDSRITVINKMNGGVSSARNLGLENANGKYIMFLDADDYLENNACERVWCETLEAPTDVVIFSSFIFPDNPKPIDWYYSVLTAKTRRYWEFVPQILFDEPCAKPFIWHQTFRKDIIDTYDIKFDESIRQGEDMMFLLSFYPRAKCFAFIQDHLYHYRWYRPGSAMWNFNDDMDERIRKHIALVEKISDYWKQQGWIEQYGKAYLEWVLQFLVGDIQSKEVAHAQEHICNVNKLIGKYELGKHFKEVRPYYKLFTRILRKGTV